VRAAAKPVMGIELRRAVLRAVQVTGWPQRRVRVAEAPWQPDDPASIATAVEAIRVALGPASRVAVAVDLALLLTKRVKLPPVPAAEKRRILSLEPDRFFAVRGGEELVVSARDDDGLVFGAREREVSAWTSALEPLGPIESVEPAPVALARALSRAGVNDATVVLDRAADGVGVVEVAGGQVRAARRVRGDLADAAAAIAGSLSRELSAHAASATVCVDPWDDVRAQTLGAAVPSVTARGLPTVAEVPPAYLAAYGAAIGIGVTRDAALMPAEVARSAAGRRRRSLATAGAACALAFVFAVAAADVGRTRAERRLDERIAGLRARAGEVSALQQEAEALTREATAVATLEARRPDVLEVLQLLTQLLPHDSHVRSLRWAGGREWQMEGRSGNAARLVPLFEDHPRLEGVRFLESTSRVTSRGQTYESFSLAFRLVPGP
jgi:type IV pilus assembly PilN-like protein